MKSLLIMRLALLVDVIIRWLASRRSDNPGRSLYYVTPCGAVYARHGYAERDEVCQNIGKKFMATRCWWRQGA